MTVQIDETNGLLPGMNVDATVVVSESRGVLSVPVSAVSRGNLVLVKTDSATSAQEGNAEGLPVGYEYVEVTLGTSNDDYIEITSGLEEGDQIAYIQTSEGGGFFFGGMPMGGGGEAVMVTTGGY